MLFAFFIFFQLQAQIIIGHRGASGYLPEHTLESYKLAIEQGADYIEPDLVSTKDGILISRHENDLTNTTDVSSKFPNRKTTKTIDGIRIQGWFSEDFTLTEIKTLKAKQAFKFRSKEHDGKYSIATFDEIIKLVLEESKKRNRVIGLYPEIKHPTYFRSVGHPLEDLLVSTLKSNGLTPQNASIFIQAFELTSLKNLKSQTHFPLIYLVDDVSIRPYDHIVANDPRTYGDMMLNQNLKELAKTVYGIGPSKRLIVPQGLFGDLKKPTDLIKRAHEAGLKVHPYTFRSDKTHLHPSYMLDPEKEYIQFFALGVDGVFSDFPDHATSALKKYKANSQK